MGLPVPLSVLDLSPVAEGETPRDALNNSLDVARTAERLGYHRYWVAEHHNMPGVASTSPPVLLAHIAAGTSVISVGSGGVMLPNHAPLVVAEQFGMLEALHPGRVELGLGRAPGTDPTTAQALRRGPLSMHDDFPDQLAELLGYFNGSLPPEHRFSRVSATTGLGYRPRIWMLGSSDYGAHVAGVLGMPYSFAHHFASDNTVAALHAYRSAFRPSSLLAEPYAMLGVNVICAPTDEEANWLAQSGRLAILRLRSGRPGRYPSPEDAAAYPYTDFEREQINAWTQNHVIGSPDTCRAKLQALLDRTHADELIVTTMTHDHSARIRSFELLADVCGVGRADTADAAATVTCG